MSAFMHLPIYVKPKCLHKKVEAKYVGANMLLGNCSECGIKMKYICDGWWEPMEDEIPEENF